MSKPRPVVRVDWVDSARNAGWHAPRFAREKRDLRCSSVGWLVDDTPDEITVASHIAWPDGDVCDTMTIPRCAVLRIKKIGVLEEPPKRRRRARA